MNKRHYEHTLPNIRGSLSNTYFCSHIYHSDFFPKVRKDTLFCREIISEAGKLNAGKGEIRDKRGMDQKREEADMYLFRHGITREKDRAKTRWQKVEKNKAE